MNLTYKQRDNIWLNTVKKKQLLFYIHFFKVQQDSDKIKEKTHKHGSKDNYDL